MKLKIHKFFREHKFILYILILSAILRLIFFSRFSGIWWDSAVYIGMAKSMFGTFGFWEFLRPIGWPFILGLLWKLNLDVVFFGRLLEVFCSFGIVYLVYLIGKKIFDKKIALFASFILSLNAIFFFLGFRLYSSVPASFFILLAYYLVLIDGKFRSFFIAGISAGLAMLIRYPVAFLVVPLCLKLGWNVLKRRSKSVQKFFIFNLTSLSLFGIYLYYNYIKFGDAFISLKAGLSSISTNHGVPIIIMNYPLFYLVFLFLFLNFLIVFLGIGLYKLIKQMNEKKFFFILLPLILFGGFLQLFVSMREERYVVPILFVLCLIVGVGFVDFKFKKLKYILLSLYVVVSFILFSFMPYAVGPQPFYAESDVLEMLKLCPKEARVASSSPLAAVHWDNVQPYYGEWTTPQIKNHVEDIECIFYSSCDYSGEFPFSYFENYYDLNSFSDEEWCKEYVLVKKNE